jgi:multicomponent Na+:H+ antiporter subunit C
MTMSIWLAVMTGCLYAAGTYMMLRRSLFKVILGLVLLSHGANLLIFTAGGLTRAQPPILPPDGQLEGLPPAADPLPQALMLTAIVISFAVLAFALVLFHRVYQTIGSDDSDDLKVSEP